MKTLTRVIPSMLLVAALSSCSDDLTDPLNELATEITEATNELVEELEEAESENSNQIIADPTVTESTPAMVEPEVEVPVIEEPVVEEPVVEEPVVEEPVVEEPVVEEPVVEEPVVEEPVVVAPVVPEPTPIPTGLIAEVSADDVLGTYVLGAPPAAAGSITIEPFTNDDAAIEIISGGSSVLTVGANEPFSTIYVLSDDEGYFEILLPAETSSAELIATYSTVQLDDGTADIQVSVGAPTGGVSQAATQSVTTTVVGLGDVQVSVSWDTETDLDLYLYEPDGTVIDFFDDVSPSGGTLDLDSNVLCRIDGINNENITYEGVTPPSGTYSVSVDFYSNCSATTNTNFVVTVRANGTVTTFTSTFTPADVGEERSITTFTIP